MQFTASIIADYLNGTIEGNPDTVVANVAKIEEATPNDLVFLSNPKYEEHLYTTRAGIALVSSDLVLRHAVDITLIRVENPYKSFAGLLELYVAAKSKKSGISPLAHIDPSAVIAPGAYIGEFTVIGPGVKIGTDAYIYPQVYIGDNVSLGDNVKLYPGVRIYEDCVLHNNITIHSGTVIGGDGFGFAPTENGDFQKIPQIGNVLIEDNVEIGANSCVDRATMGSTVIHRGVKLDNLIQIAHNVTIGENTVMAAQVGVAGSTKIGRNVMMGGQVGIVGHISIADNVKIASQSGIGQDVTKDGETMFGSPATSGISHHRAQAIFKQLPDMRRQLIELSRTVKEMKSEKQE